jgi:hypothetical protein
MGKRKHFLMRKFTMCSPLLIFRVTNVEAFGGQEALGDR